MRLPQRPEREMGWAPSPVKQPALVNSIQIQEYQARILPNIGTASVPPDPTNKTARIPQWIKIESKAPQSRPRGP